MLSRYVRGDIDRAGAIALERHLLGCSSCRASLGELADPQHLERGWHAVLEAVNATRRGLLERLLARMGLGEETRRLVAATPSLRGSWLAAVTVVLAFAVVAAVEFEGTLVFLAVAPLLPVIGVAAAYGPGIDPTYEVGLAAPFSSLRLLLMRAVAVLIATTVLAAIAGSLITDQGWTAAVWLLPALGLTTGSIALSTVMSAPHAARLVTLV